MKEQEMCELQSLGITLRDRLLNKSSPVSKLGNDDKQTHFNTGLPSYAVFNVCLSKCAPGIREKGKVGSGLSLEDKFLLVLMKLPH